jgi:hypothetical protein
LIDHKKKAIGIQRTSLMSIGRGVMVDYKQAMSWLIKAAEQGAPNHQYRLAEWSREKTLNDPPNDTQSFTYLLRAANNGHEAAIVDIAQFYIKGTGTDINYEAATQWLQTGLKKKNAEAAYRLAVMYQGMGYHRLLHSHYLNEAARMGHSQAIGSMVCPNCECASVQYIARYSMSSLPSSITTPPATQTITAPRLAPLQPTLVVPTSEETKSTVTTSIPTPTPTIVGGGEQKRSAPTVSLSMSAIPSSNTDYMMSLADHITYRRSIGRMMATPTPFTPSEVIHVIGEIAKAMLQVPQHSNHNVLQWYTTNIMISSSLLPCIMSPLASLSNDVIFIIATYLHNVTVPLFIP